MQMLHVLMVDDEVDLALLIKQRFKKEIQTGKYKFTFAIDGRNALDVLAQDDTISFVITDLNMPNMNGLELLLHIKSKYPQLEVVIMSAYSDDEAIQTAKKAGADNFLFKPIDFNLINQEFIKHLPQ